MSAFLLTSAAWGAILGSQVALATRTREDRVAGTLVGPAARAGLAEFRPGTGGIVRPGAQQELRVPNYVTNGDKIYYTAGIPKRQRRGATRGWG